MKKILSILMWLFVVTPLVSPLLNIVNAQWENEPSDGASKVSTTSTSIGVTLEGDCITWLGKDCFEYETIVGIKDYQANKYTATSIAQDVIFAATYMVWTVLTLILLYCGLMYIFASWSGKDTSKYKKWLQNAAIWSILVWWAYAIVRLIQYIARW